MKLLKNFVIFALAKSDDPSVLPDDDTAPPSTTTPTTTTSTTTTTPEIEDGECMTAELDYFGKKEVTQTVLGQTGAACRNWADIKPPLRKVDNFQQKHNFCR